MAKVGRPKGSKSRQTMGPTIQVTYRMPKVIYDKLAKIAESMFQPMPDILRAAAVEYVRNHRPTRHTNTGISLKWPDEVRDHLDSIAEEIHTMKDEESVNTPDRSLSGSMETTSAESDSGMSRPPKEGGE